MKLLLALLLFLPCFAHAQLSAREWGDVLLGDPHHPPELDDPALSAVTREFGPAVINMARLPFDSDVATADAPVWSSWWFPKIDRDLFDDGHGTSALEKYDRFRAALTGQPSRAAAYELAAWSPERPRWEGLCDAWAIAATAFPEPTAPRSFRMQDGSVLTFTVGDLKALLLKTVDNVPASSFKFYGQKFTGNQDGWIYPDIFPQELFRYVEKQLFERHKSFVMDHDPGVEVWSEPVYQANYRFRAVPGRSDAVAGQLWLYSGGSFGDKAQRDQVGLKQTVREYDFVLYGEREGTNLRVTWGEWVKGDLVDSRRDHPDFVYNVSGRLQRAGQNPEIDPAVVDRILGI